MTTAPETPRRKIGCLPIGGGVAVAFIALTGILFAIVMSRSRSAIEAELARMRSKGKPTSAAELTKRDPVHPEDPYLA